MPFTSYLDSLLAKLMFGRTGSPYTPPATLYVALSTTTPAADGTGFTEPTGNAYARVAVANNNANWVAATSQPGSGEAQANGAVITFPRATGPWGTCTYFGIYDAAANGNLLGYAALATAEPVVNGTQVSFDVQTLTVTLQ